MRRALGSRVERARRRPPTPRWLFAFLALLAWAPSVSATPFIWDQDDDKLDDRIEEVHLLGYAFSFEQADTLLRQRIEVALMAGTLVYGLYVDFDHAPTNADLLALTVLGMPVLHRFESLPAVRSVGTFFQAQAVAALAGVERVEAAPLIYPEVRAGTASMGVRDPSQQVFPTWAGTGGPSGEGEVVAFLDTGINDAPEGTYPGHESLVGRCLGGAIFTNADSSLNTPRDGSVNPADHGGTATSSHGTHVAAIAVGNGGTSGYAVGCAPLARFVDVKALNDVGVGTGIPEALDWCIHNRARNWGAGPDYEGIDVINLSLSSLDESDGNDLACRLADRAAELGVVVVASMGNSGKSYFVPSPAGGDRVLAVGAFDNQRTGAAADDALASFSNAGPRASDGDSDTGDEQKPDLLASGVAVLSADGNVSSDGAQYQILSGTSMAAAFVTGAVAALRSAYPSLDPAEIGGVLRATARRNLTVSPPGVGGSDPRWNSRLGFGALDLYAARLELEQPERSQIRRLTLEASPTTLTATLWTQRERGAAHFVFERAPDQDGTPGGFIPVDSVAAVGDSSLADPGNLTSYSSVWPVPPSELGTPFWYRASFTEGGARYDSPARRFVNPAGPSVATIELTVIHNAYDHDVSGFVHAGSAPIGSTPTSEGLSFPLPGSSAAYQSEWHDGPGATGNVAWKFRIEVPAGPAEACLPPSASCPWRLRVDEAGYLNQSGQVREYRLIWHSPAGDQSFAGEPIPEPTLEQQTVYATIPTAVTGVTTAIWDQGLSGYPNPVTSGGAVTFSIAAMPPDGLRLYDLAGREVGHADFAPGSGGYFARWEARDGAGRFLPAGLYFARAGSMGRTRLVVVSR